MHRHCMNAEEETLQETTQGAERGRAENATWVTSVGTFARLWRVIQYLFGK